MRIEHHVSEELARAVQKFPMWPTDPLHALAILGEEFGELTKAVLQYTYESHKGVTRGDIRTEAIQTAAMALRFAMSLNSYVYAQHDQHAQEPLGIMTPAEIDKAAVLMTAEAKLRSAVLAWGECLKDERRMNAMTNFQQEQARAEHDQLAALAELAQQKLQEKGLAELRPGAA